MAQYARRQMARRTGGPRRSDSPRTYVRSTRIIGGISLLVLAGAIAVDFANDRFWARHALFTGLAASLIVVAVTARHSTKCSSVDSASAGPCSRSTHSS